jgi:ribosomal protein S18 acetylase RimI-like enzyme
MTDLIIRAAVAGDLDEVGRMAGAMVRFHHGLDPLRYFLVDEVERGYARFFSTRLSDDRTLLRVAQRGAKLEGYAYAALEPRDWNALLDACGALHDIFVVEDARRKGVANALLDDVLASLARLGAPRVVLMTAVQNEAAQKLFARHGFRTSMLEMLREL